MLVNLYCSFLSLVLLLASPVRSQADEGCLEPNSNRCADGTCKADCASSQMSIPRFCSNYTSNYQCGNGLCVSSYMQCLEKGNLTLENRTKCAVGG